MNEIPTPETNKAWDANQCDSTEGDPWLLSSNLERRLTVARLALKIVRGDSSSTRLVRVASETLTATAPK